MPLSLHLTLGWSAVVAAVYVCVVLAWGGLLGALFAGPPVALMVAVVSGTFIVRRARGAVSLRAWLLLVLTMTVGSVLLLPLLMLGGGDPYVDLVGLWCILILPLAGLLVGTALVVRLVERGRNGVVSESAGRGR